MGQNDDSLAKTNEDSEESVIHSPGKWTEEIEEYLNQCIEKEEHIEDITTAINSIFTGVEFSQEAVTNKRIGLIEKNRPEITIIRYLSTGHTIHEIANHFKLSLNEAEDIVKANFDGYEIWPTQDDSGQIRYILLPLPEGPLTISPRIWKMQTQPGGEAWIWIKFPNNHWDQIKVVPLSDVHYGASSHLNDKFQEYVDWIKNNPNVFAFINGDLLENALRDSIAGAIYESKMFPKEQIEGMMKILAPIAHKILWAIPGNHEDRTRKHAGFDPLEVICGRLNIPFYNDAMHATLWWGDHKWEFYAKHGNTGSATKGGKLNAAKKSLDMMEHTHFVIMGHTHDAMSNKIEIIVRNFKTFELELLTSYIVVCPSFYGYFGTYASKHGMAPASSGTATCRMFSDGDWKADIW